MILVDYEICNECQNPKVYYTCLKCGKCGRKFDHGYMVDDGGTTLVDDEE